MRFYFTFTATHFSFGKIIKQKNEKKKKYSSMKSLKKKRKQNNFSDYLNMQLSLYVLTVSCIVPHRLARHNTVATAVDITYQMLNHHFWNSRGLSHTWKIRTFLLFQAFYGTTFLL